jgi:hypothetical protein
MHISACEEKASYPYFAQPELAADENMVFASPYPSSQLSLQSQLVGGPSRYHPLVAIPSFSLFLYLVEEERLCTLNATAGMNCDKNKLANTFGE